MRANPSPECVAEAEKASGGRLSRSEIQDVFDRVLNEKIRLQKAGQIDGLAERLGAFVMREAQQARLAAAMQRRHAALNVIVRDRLDQTVDGFIAAGLTPKQAILAVMEGTQRGVEGGRNSVAALTLAYEARYAGGLFADLGREVPAFQNLLRDRRFDDDIAREMAELKDGGIAGITGNADAAKVAKIFATYLELSRTEANRFGASIGKLDGWSGPQVHDDIRLLKAGKANWIEAILPRLDIARTFPDASEGGEVRQVLGDVFDTIVTGLPNKPTPREKGQRVNPANLAKSLGKSRVLYFRDADAALAYRADFGHGNTTSGIFAYLRRMAGTTAMLETLGPNPEIMFGSIVDRTARKVRASTAISDTEKTRQIAALNSQAGSLRSAFDVMSGLTSRPVSVKAAKISADIRAVQSMAKLGGAVLSSIPSDTMTAAIASQFRGGGFLKGLFRQIDGIRRGRGEGEFREIATILGEGFDGLIGHIVSPAVAADGPVGKLARLQDVFFRVNGLSWWTDVSRASAARMISAEMGMRSATSFDKLPANYQHVLGLHGIDQVTWDAIRQAQFREINGQTYVTPDRIRDLPDDAIRPLVAARIGAIKTTTADDRAAQEVTILSDGRRQLEMTVLRFVADELNYGVVETDAASRRWATWNGTRPGTFAGEAARFIMQFKGFPVAFTQRVLGRAFLGGRGKTKYERLMNNAPHIGALIGGLAMAGYMQIVMKDAQRGYWPPRDPSDPKTWLAALAAGGAMGIYGDFLFGETNRFGGGLLETAAGPAVGNVGDIGNLLLKARNAALGENEKVRLADWLNVGLNNTPFVNLAYVRPVLDFLALNAIREAASPGFNRRQEQRRFQEYGQRRFYPAILRD